MKYRIKAQDILPYMETKLITLVENPEKIHTVMWNKDAPSVVSIEGYYTRFAVGSITSKEEILKRIEVKNG